MLQCGLVRSNFAFVMVSRSSRCFPLSTKHGLQTGAGEGNRTLVISLEGFCSTIELHPQILNRNPTPAAGGGGRIRTFVDAKSADLQSAAIDRSATPPNLRQTRREISLFSPPCGRALLANPMVYVKGICRCRQPNLQGPPCAPVLTVRTGPIAGQAAAATNRSGSGVAIPCWRHWPTPSASSSAC